MTNKVKIFLVIRDKGYGMALGRYLATHGKAFEIAVEENYDPSVIGADHNSVILTDMACLFVFMGLETISSRLIFLTNRIQPTGEEIWHSGAELFKFTAAAQILKVIRAQTGCCGPFTDSVHKDQHAYCIGFTGAGSGVGKTAIAIGIARDISKRYGRRVFYLNAESFSSTKAYFEEATGDTISKSEFIYYFFKHAGLNEGFSPETYMFRDGFNVWGFYPNGGRNELKSLEELELRQVVEFLQSRCGFDFIFIDFSGDMDKTETCLLDQCSKVYLISDGSRASTVKNAEMEKYIESKDMSGFGSKCTRVLNKYGSDEKTQMADYVVARDDNSFYPNGGIMQISINGGFGSDLQIMGDRLIEEFGAEHADGPEHLNALIRSGRGISNA